MLSDVQDVLYKNLTSQALVTRIRSHCKVIADQLPHPGQLHTCLTIVYDMNYQYYGHEGSDPQVVNPTRTRTDGQQGLLTKAKYRSKRGPSDDKPPRRQFDQEKANSGFHVGLPWGYRVSIGPGDETAELQSKNQQMEDHIKAQWRKEQELLTRLEERERRLQEKEAELEELKNTLCMYNDCSEADIQRMVDSINTKVQNLACNTAIPWLNTVSRISDSAKDDGEVSEVEMDNIKRLIGIQLVNALSGESQFADTLLPLAWQASILATVAKIISSFSATLATSSEERAGDAVLKTIADGVMMRGEQRPTTDCNISGRGSSLSSSFVEAQPAYGRWRFITHKYLREALSSREQSAIRAYASEALESCRAVGRLTMKSQCPNDQALENAFQAPLRAIMEETFGLATIIQEKMITANYGPHLPPSGAPFDPESMVVEKGDKVSANDQVVCTTGIGLLCWKKEGRDSSSRLWPQYVFKQAQVFTEASLNDLIASP